MEIHTGIRTQSVESSAISRDKTLQFRTLDARLKDSTGRLTNLNHGRMDLLQSEGPPGEISIQLMCEMPGAIPLLLRPVTASGHPASCSEVYLEFLLRPGSHF